MRTDGHVPILGNLGVLESVKVCLRLPEEVYTKRVKACEGDRKRGEEKKATEARVGRTPQGDDESA